MLTTPTRRGKDYYVISTEMIVVTISEGEIVCSDHPEMSPLLLSKTLRAEVI